MASGQSEVSICNIALSHIGSQSITALSQDTKPARECNRLYAITRDGELRARNWNFSIKRTQLAADADDPSWGYDKRYQLPVDCLKVLEVDATQDWRVEAGNLADSGKTYLLTDLGAPIYIRYVERITDPALFDVLFVDALAMRLAMDLAIPITQSNTIYQGARESYLSAVQRASAQNAIESAPRAQPETTWVLARRRGTNRWWA